MFPGIIGALVTIAENIPAEIAVAEKVVSGVAAASAPMIDGLKAFLATPSGQQVEGWLGSLFHHTATPDAALVVTPKVVGEPSPIIPAPVEPASMV